MSRGLGLRTGMLAAGMLMAAACAKQGFPNGGPRDTQPPEVRAARPASATRNFDQQEFRIDFDEYVVLKDADNNVIVSPPMKQKPEYTTKGRSVVVRIKDTLQPNTTYHFQFQEAIADFTEGNALPSFDYVFSTGTDMDTLCLGGTAVDALTGKPLGETVTVMAYAEALCTTDTVALAAQPSYVTRADKEGHFEFHYIAAGRYRLVALADKDRNLRPGAAEAIGWDTTLVEAHAPVAAPTPDTTTAKADKPAAAPMPDPSGTSTSSRRKSKDGNRPAAAAKTDTVAATATAATPIAPATTLRLSEPRPTQQRIRTSDFSERGRITIATLLPLQQPSVEGAEGVFRLNQRRDTLTFWTLDEAVDSVRLVVRDTNLCDTLTLRYRAPRKSGGRKGRQAQSLEPKPALVKPVATPFYDRVTIDFAMPVSLALPTAEAEVMRLKDSTVTRHGIRVDDDGMHARIDATLAVGETYSVHLRDSLFADPRGHRSDSLAFRLTPKDYATLSVTVSGRTGLIVQVVDSRDSVVAQQAATGGKLTFSHLTAAPYRLRAVVDTDGDGQWTPGDYPAGRQPEEVLHYDKSLQLRDSWEVEERWNLE